MKVSLLPPGTRLKLLRVARGVRQRDLALRVGLAPSVLSDIENNYREASANEIAELCRELDADQNDLLGGAE